MHFDPRSFDAARHDIHALKEMGEVDCVAGCYRCVLSYFNQPDHEHIERRDEDLQKILLRLAFSQTSAPEETRRHPGAAHEPQGMLVSGERDSLPKSDDDPLKIAGTTLPRVWRKKRIVAFDETEASDELITALDAKGVRYFILPTAQETRQQVLKDLALALKD
jgi:hypothetical protein